jgi:chaperonin GroES
MNLKPLSNHVLIEQMEEEEKKTQSGIVLPDTVEKKKQSRGKIIAIGPGKWDEDGEKRIPMEVKVGDMVLFKEPWSDDNKLKEGDKKYFLVNEDEILAIVA